MKCIVPTGLDSVTVILPIWCPDGTEAKLAVDSVLRAMSLFKRRPLSNQKAKWDYSSPVRDVTLVDRQPN